MDAFATQPAAERETYFQEAAAQLGLPAHVIEKDFWVCWTLKRLFALESVANNLLFKGGTSLSKAHGLIRRFSEDIDLSIHRASMGFEGDNDPANPELSNKTRRKQSEALRNAAREKVTGEVQSELSTTIGELLDSESWELTPDPTDPDGQSLAIAYPRTGSTQDAAAYIKPSVKIEFGARSDHWPAETKPVRPYLVDACQMAWKIPKPK
jgi:hypothetical protein